MYRFVIAFAFVLLGTACSGGVLTEATQIPTPEVWRVQYSSEMRFLLPIMHQCMQTQPYVGLAATEYSSAPEASYTSDFIFHWGDINPRDYSAYVLWMDDIKLVVHSSNPLNALSFSQVESIFWGDFTSWGQLGAEESGDIQVWIYPEDSILQRTIHDLYPGLDNSGMNALIAPDVEVLRDQIKEDPDAIGFVPGIWQDDALKPLEITASTQAQGAGIPVVLLVRSNLDDAQSRWIKCIQESWPRNANQ
jgi:DNA-binding transcriptional LysR family regulator